MPPLGYHAWNSLLEEENFQQIQELISRLPSTRYVFTWTRHLLLQIQTGKLEHLSTPDLEELQVGVTQLNHTFHPKLMNEPQSNLTTTINTFKQHICEDALSWIEWKRTSLQWENNHEYGQYQQRAEEEYQAWKLEHKASSCNTYLPNLIVHYKASAGCTDAEAELQVLPYLDCYPVFNFRCIHDVYMSPNLLVVVCCVLCVLGVLYVSRH